MAEHICFSLFTYIYKIIPIRMKFTVQDQYLSASHYEDAS